MLAGWLTKAAAVFGTAPTEPEPFDITCECGGVVSGTRTELQQKLHCAHCGQPVWVLPTDVYPAVKPLRRPESVSEPAKTTVDQSSSQSPPRKPKNSTRDVRDRLPRGSAAVKDVEPEQSAAAAVPSESSPELSIPQEPGGRNRRRTFQLVIVVMLALVSATGWSLWNRHVREQARSSVPRSAESGLAALHAGQFADAAAHLDAAVRGLNVLHQTDGWAQEIRRAHREAVSAEKLSLASLPELAGSLLGDGAAEDEKQRQFQSQYGDSWMLWDVALVRRPNATDTFELDVPLIVDDRPLQVTCDFPELLTAASEATPQTPQRVIFAGQIDRWVFPAEPHGPLIAVLKASTAFLWTDYESFSAAGYRPASEGEAQQTRDLLLRQRQQVLP